jgi:hypothetical protein
MGTHSGSCRDGADSLLEESAHLIDLAALAGDDFLAEILDSLIL